MTPAPGSDELTLIRSGLEHDARLTPAGRSFTDRFLQRLVDGEGSGGVVDERVERAGVELEVVPPDLDGIDVVTECPSQGRDQRRDRGQYLGRVSVRDDEARVGIGRDELRNRLEMHR